MNECAVDFSVNKRAADSYYDYELLDGSKVAKVMAVLGSNGAGKSNLLKPLSFLSWFIPDSFRATEKNEDIFILPHAKRVLENTKIELDFILPRNELTDGELEYRYYVELNSKKVVEESLKLKTSRLYSNIISRKLDPKTDKYHINNSKKYGVSVDNKILEKAPHNCSLLSYIDSFISFDPSDEDQMENIFVKATLAYFSSNRSNISAFGRKNISDNLEEAIDFYKENPEFFEKIKSMLIRYDFGIEDIKLEDRVIVNSSTGKEYEKTIPMFIHSSEDGPFNIPIYMESSGTQSAFCILALITDTLNKGGVAILDEFDNDLHPHLTIEIMNLFKSSETNNRNAQLLFNTHSPEVLKSLRMQHCYLVEKEHGISYAYRADDIEGLLARDNLYSKYVSGALGAVPDFG